MFTTGSSSINSIRTDAPGFISVKVDVGVKLKRSPFTKSILALPVTVFCTISLAELKYIFHPDAGKVFFPLLVMVMALSD